MLWVVSTLTNNLQQFTAWLENVGENLGGNHCRTRMMEDVGLRTLAASQVIFTVIKRRQRRRRRFKPREWVQQWILKREQLGAYHGLLQELQVRDESRYRNFLRMDLVSFDELLNKVVPLTRKEDTILRPAISPGERLALTLRDIYDSRTM